MCTGEVGRSWTCSNLYSQRTKKRNEQTGTGCAHAITHRPSSEICLHCDVRFAVSVNFRLHPTQEGKRGERDGTCQNIISFKLTCLIAPVWLADSALAPMFANVCLYSQLGPSLSWPGRLLPSENGFLHKPRSHWISHTAFSFPPGPRIA